VVFDPSSGSYQIRGVLERVAPGSEGRPAKRYLQIELSKWVGTCEPTRLTTGSGRVGLKFFYKFQYGLIFDPAHLEPGSSGLNPW